MKEQKLKVHPNQKVYPDQIERFIKKNGPVLGKKTAEHFDVGVRVVKRIVKTLREGGVRILPTTKGLVWMGKVKNKADAKLVKQNVDWLVYVCVSVALITSISKKLFVEAVKKLSPDDSKQLKKGILMISYVVDMKEIEQEFTPDQLKK